MTHMIVDILLLFNVLLLSILNHQIDKQIDNLTKLVEMLMIEQRGEP